MLKLSVHHICLRGTRLANRGSIRSTACFGYRLIHKAGRSHQPLSIPHLLLAAGETQKQKSEIGAGLLGVHDLGRVLELRLFAAGSINRTGPAGGD